MMTARLQSIVLFFLLLTAFAGVPVEHCDAACAALHSGTAACAHEMCAARHAAQPCSHGKHTCIHLLADEQSPGQKREQRPFVATAPGMPPYRLPARVPEIAPTLHKGVVCAILAEIRLPMLC